MKKHIIYAISFLVCAGFVSACESDLDKTVLTASKAPSGLAVDSDDPFVCSSENSGEVAFTFTWELADMGENISGQYALQFDVAGNDFAGYRELIVGNVVRKKELTSAELNDMMHSLSQPIGVATDIEVRVRAKAIVVGSSSPQLPVLVSSDKAVINVTSYARAPMHIIGSAFDSYWWGTANFWNINNYEYVMFRDNPLATDTYTAYYLHADGSGLQGDLKFNPDRNTDWGALYGKVDAGVIAKGLGGNISDITSSGYYTLTLNMASLTYSFTPYDAETAIDRTSVKLSGAALQAEVELAADPNNTHIWSVDNVTLGIGEVSFTVDGTTWSGDTFPWGKATAGGENVGVNKAGTYFVKYNDLTGHYVFYQK